MPKTIPYGIGNYAEMVEKNAYFVDKTPYVAKVEAIRNPVFLRPRRFGKSVFCSILRYYYDLNEANRFEELFGHTWIGQHPTGQQNQYIILFLNFSSIATGPTIEAIEASFKRQNNYELVLKRTEYAPYLTNMPEIDETVPVADNLARLLAYIRANDLPPLYVIIDEYDNFANQLIINGKDQLYRQLTGDDSFLKAFFKTLKEGRETQAIANIFVTGVLPITIDELASGFNIATFLTLDPDFEAMLGFTQGEVDQLLDAVYQEQAIDPETREEVNAVIKNHYNGYHFVDTDGEMIYNSTILMYFLSWFHRYKAIPDRLIDPNLKTDIAWVRRLTASNPQLTEAFVHQLTLENRIGYDFGFLLEKFDMHQFFEE